MKPHDLFDVLTRGAGLLQIVSGLALLPMTVRNLQSFSNDHELFQRVLAGALTLSGMEIILGCLLLFGARVIANLFFRNAAGGGETPNSDHRLTATGAPRRFDMSAVALFGVAVRVIGIWNIAYGLWWIPGVGIMLYDFTQTLPDPNFQESLWRELGSSALRFTVGMALFFNADRIVRWAYFASANETSPDTAGPG